MPNSKIFSELSYTYTPARYQKHKKSGHLIVFDCLNPSTGKMQRVKRKVNELRKYHPVWADFRAAIVVACNEYNRQLSNGWLPWDDDHVADAGKMIDMGNGSYLQSKSGTDAKTAQVVETQTPLYVQSKSTGDSLGDSEGTAGCSGSIVPEHPEERSALDQAIWERENVTVAGGFERWLQFKNNLRPDTLRSYRDIAKVMSDWVDERFPGLKLREFSRTHANIFMEYADAREVNANTYNNYIKRARAFFGWAVSAALIDSNPFDKIQEKGVEEKFRDVIPLEDLTKIRNYFDHKQPEFVTIMLLMYFGGIRPKEISRVRVHQVKLSNRGIEMPGYQTKTHAARVSPLSKELVKRLADMIHGARPTDYLFGQGYKPGPEYLSVKSYQKQWRNMRKALKLPASYQLYSLRDCSAFYRLESKNIAPLDAMKALGHQTIKQTMVYANHEVTDLSERLDNGTPTF